MRYAAARQAARAYYVNNVSMLPTERDIQHLEAIADAAAAAMTVTGELPLRIIDQPGGAIVRCLCGTELVTLRKGTTEMSRLRAAVSLPHLSPDLSPGGLAIMVAHAKQCKAVQS